MRLELDGQPVDPALVTYNSGMSFGRFDSDRIAVHEYELFMDRAAVIADLSDAYGTVRDEILEDDEKFGETSEFIATGYVDLDEAFDSPAALAEVLDGYFCRELLELYVTRRDRFLYVINSVDRVTVTPEGVLYQGRAFRHLRDDPADIPGGGAGIRSREVAGHRARVPGALRAGLLAAALVLALHGLTQIRVGQLVAIGVAVGTVAALDRRRDRRGADWLWMGLGAGVGAAAGTWLGTVLIP